MRKYFQTLITISLLLNSGNINAQMFQWGKTIKSEGFDEGFDLTTDAIGNTYVGGMIEFNADFGNNVILSSAGIHDIYLAKYDPTGKLVWAKRAGGIGGDKIQSVVLDNQGHIYVAGEFEDSCYWDNIMKYTNGPPGVNNMFVAKYDTSGHVMWVRNIGVAGPLQTRGYGITCDAQGNVYACGGTKGDTYYDNNFLFSTAGDYDGTVVKFDPDGNFVWARRMGGIDSDKAYGIVSDNNGSIYVTGYFVGNIDFSSSNITLNGHGHTDIFLAKYDTAGSLQWAKMAGDTGFDRGWDITINVNGEIVITGEFQTGYFGSNLVHSHGNEDMFLAGYDSNGNNLWVTSGGGVEDDIGRGVIHDNSGNLFVIGDYASTGAFLPAHVSSNGFSDIFVAKYNSDGSNLNWIRSFGGHDNDRGRGVGVDIDGNVSVCGEFVDSMMFDGINLIGDSNLDVFVAKIVPGNFCSVQATVTTQNPCNGMCNGIATATVIGQSPFNYNWSTVPSQNTSAAVGLCQGTYTVTITDANGCSASASTTLTDPPLLQASVTSTDATCAGSCNGTAVATASGQGPFTYSWSTSPPQTGATANSLCQGTFTVTATDANGCTASSIAVLTDPSPIQLTATIINASCIGCSDGSIDLFVNGGTANYQYLWSTGSTMQNLNNVSAGIYTACITDANNCQSCDSFIITEPSSGIISLNSTSDFYAYPNPFKTSSTIHIKNSAAPGTKIFLYTNTGEKVYQSEFSGNEFILPANDLKSGIYFLQIENNSFDELKIIPLEIEE